MITSEHWNYYQTDSLAMVPYMPGTPVYRDGVLSTLYYEAKKEGKIPLVFCGEDLNHDAFVSFFEKRKTLQVLCRVREDKTLMPVGFSWVDNPKGVSGAKSVVCGFCFFGDSSKDHTARDLAKLGLAYWFMALKITVVHGVMLAENIAAKNFAARLGFEQVAIVPDYHYDERVGELVDARVMMLKAGKFLPSFNYWFEQFAVAKTE